MNKGTKNALLIVLLIFVGGIVLARVGPDWKFRGKLLDLIAPLAPFIEFGSKHPYLFTFLFIVAVIFLVIVAYWVRYRIESREIFKAKKKHPNFFEEMRLVLHSTLSPLNFVETEIEADYWTSSVTFNRGDYSVSLQWAHDGDSYWIGASSSNKTETVKNQFGDEFERPVYDFSISSDISGANEFKNETTEKLNKWVFTEGIK